jgi:hypothetical protein
MSLNTAFSRRFAAIATPVGVLLGLAACSGLLDTTQNLARNAQITVEGTSAVPLTLVLSNQYVGTADPTTGTISISLLAADTFVSGVPIDRTYPLGGQARILVRLINPDSIEAATVRLRILLDGVEEVYNKEAALISGGYLEYRFAYY